jgi:hypothetical protein
LPIGLQPELDDAIDQLRVGLEGRLGEVFCLGENRSDWPS